MLHRITIVLAVVGLALTAAFVGLADAATHTTTGLPIAFTMDSVTTGGRELPIKIYASGAITAVGTWHEKTVHGVDHVAIAFPKGEIFVTAREALSWRPDIAACIAKARGGTTWAVTGGTRAYRGARGGGTYTDAGTMLGARDAAGACLGPNTPPPYVVVTADFVGKLTTATR